MKKLSAILALTSLISISNVFSKPILRFFPGDNLSTPYIYQEKDSIYKFHKSEPAVTYEFAPFRYECPTKWEKGKDYHQQHVWSMPEIVNCAVNANSFCDDAVFGERFCQDTNGWYTAKIKKKKINGKIVFEKGFESNDKKEWISLKQFQVNQERIKLKFNPLRERWIEKERAKKKISQKKHCKP